MASSGDGDSGARASGKLLPVSVIVLGADPAVATSCGLLNSCRAGNGSNLDGSKLNLISSLK